MKFFCIKQIINKKIADYFNPLSKFQSLNLHIYLNLPKTLHFTTFDICIYTISFIMCPALKTF